MRPHMGRCVFSIHRSQHQPLTLSLSIQCPRQCALSQSAGLISGISCGHSRGPIYHSHVVEERAIAQRCRSHRAGILTQAHSVTLPVTLQWAVQQNANLRTRKPELFLYL